MVNFLQISQLSIRSGAHKRFAICDANFAKIVAPPGGGNRNDVLRLKG